MRSCLVSLLLAMAMPVQLVSAQTPAPAENRSVEERLQAIEDKLQQLEKRVDAATQTTAAAPDKTAAPSGDRLEALDQKIRVLERNRELDQEAALAKAKETPIITAGPEGFSISNADKSYRFKLGGYAQADGRFFYDDPTHALISTFNVRRARLNFDGTVGKYVDFRIAPEFGNGSVTLLDAYGDVRFKPYVVLRGGKFKDPVGLEVLANDTELTFIERSLVNDIMPGRDTGFYLYGDAGGRFTYQAGYVNGAPDGGNIDLDVNKGKDAVARLFFTPFAEGGPSFLSGLGFGLGVSSGRQNGTAAAPNLASFKTTAGQATFFAYNTGASATFAAGRRIRWSPQMYYYNGPFGFMGEYVGEVEVVSNAASGAHELNNYAWQVTGSWVITGEKKSYRGVVPKRRLGERKFVPSTGAWEVAGRYTVLQVDPATFTLAYANPTTQMQTARAWGIGLNWYLNKNVKVSGNYEQTYFRKNVLSAGSVRPDEKTFLQRLQFVF